MYKRISLVIAAIFCLFFSARAQTDSTHYDLGRISVKKSFTQSVTIKGSDLEKYPFANLADAINVWLSGTLTNSGSVVYVVDGNIINDVNAYSIYDIDEITLVQNALTTVSGGGARQTLLIKTRTGGPGKHGIDAAGQTSQVNLRDPNNTAGTKSQVNVYNQYYLGGYSNSENSHLNASADYQRDVFPVLTSPFFQVANPLHYNRLKFNVYADTKLGQGSTLSARINYVPQVSSSQFMLTTGDPNVLTRESSISRESQHLFNAAIGLKSEIAPGFTNTLSAAYNHYNYFGDGVVTYNFSNNGVPGGSGYNAETATDRASNLLIRDNLSYQKQLGDFNIEPAVNFSYRLLHDTSGFANYSLQNTAENPPAYNVSGSSYYYHYKLFLLTPSLNIAYKDIFNIQAGFAGILNPDKDFTLNYHLQRLSPFFSASVDIAKLASISSISLRLFGSAARQNQVLADDNSTLIGYGLPASSIPSLFPSTGYNSGGATLVSNYDPYKEYNNYQAGLVLGLSKKFTLNYSFAYGYYKTLAAVVIPQGANGSVTGLIYLDDKIISNRIGLTYDYNSGAFSWKPGFNIAESSLQLIQQPLINTEYLDKGHRYTGGFTNRFGYKNFFAGLDVLYQFGERPFALIATPINEPGNLADIGNNSFSLQSLYAGTRIRVSHLKYAEVFINSRNLLQNKSSDITDNRRFLGLGFKLGL